MSDDNMVTLTIDGQEITVPKGELIIRAAERMGLVIPRFCDHPLLDPVGACRQCLVEIDGQPKPATACTTPCGDGWKVKTHLTSTIAEKAQAGQLEFLLINHPLDCPMCDKGGECPLQDQSLAHGNNHSRFIDEKRRYDKPVAVSAQVLLDRERCVLCARCTRFSDQIAGDPFIELFERGALEQVAIYEDEPYESYFSGNVIQICPVGALTSTSYRFKARPFDLVSTKSVCDQCSAGCTLTVQSRRGEVERQLARTNMPVNEMWSCDKGRFGFAHLGAPERVTTPLVRERTGLVETDWARGLVAASEAMTAEGATVGVITGGRLADEDAYAVGKLARTVLGTNDVVTTAALGADEDAAALAALVSRNTANYADVEAAPVIITVGLDAEDEVPILHLRIRKAWRNNKAKLVPIGASMGSLAPYAWRHLATGHGDEVGALATLGRGVGIAGLADVASTSDFSSASTTDVVSALRETTGAVILVGERAPVGALAAAGMLADQVGGMVAWVPRRSNARGAVEVGLHPGLLPGGRSISDDDARAQVADVWGVDVPSAPGRDLTAMLEAAASGDIDVLWLVGVDLVTDGPDADLVARALKRATVVMQDLALTPTSEYADVILPVTAAQERAGTRTNWEGRRQSFKKALDGPALVRDDWEVAVHLAALLGQDLGFQDLEGLQIELGSLIDGERPQAAWPSVAVTQPAPHDGLRAGVRRWLLNGSTDLTHAEHLLATARTPVIDLAPADAEANDIKEGDHVEVSGNGQTVILPARVRVDQVEGTVTLPSTATDTDAAALGPDVTVTRIGLRESSAPRDVSGGDGASGSDVPGTGVEQPAPAGEVSA